MDDTTKLAANEYRAKLRPFRVLRMICEGLLVLGLVVTFGVHLLWGLGAFLVLCAIEMFFFAVYLKGVEQFTLKSGR